MEWKRLARRFGLACAAAALIVVVSACGRSAEITFVDDGGSYSAMQVEQLARELELPSIAGRPVADATALRHEALVELRSQQGVAAELADLITEEFPSDARSVPFYGEAATVDGVASWVIVEVYGSEGSSLDRERLWVFDRASGSVIRSVSFR